MSEPTAKEVANVRGKLTKAAYELNMLLKVAASYGMEPSVDVVERESHSEVLVQVKHDRD